MTNDAIEVLREVERYLQFQPKSFDTILPRVRAAIAAAKPPPPFEWEEIVPDQVQRVRVPGGWIYEHWRPSKDPAYAIVNWALFVPDAP